MKIVKMENGSPEIYKAVQGEGLSLGMACIFVRFFGCTLDCTWCDTDYSKRGEFIDMEKIDVAKKILEETNGGKIKRIIFTGGEPTLYQNDILSIMKELKKVDSDWYFEVETNGTVEFNNEFLTKIDRINCSPKLSDSGNVIQKRYKPDVLTQIADIGSFKFVTDGNDDEIKEIKKIIKECKIPETSIMLMPKGDNSAEVVKNSRKIIDIVVEEGWKVTTRLHILLFEKKRGV